jgi:hypothetical protein
MYSSDPGRGDHVKQIGKFKPVVALAVNLALLGPPQLRYSQEPSSEISTSTHVNMLTRSAFNLPRHAVPSIRRAVSLQVPASPRARCRALTVSAARAQSILHGSREAKEAGEREIQQHSRLIGRGKYLHGIESASFQYEVAQLGTLNRFFDSPSSQAGQCQGI